MMKKFKIIIILLMGIILVGCKNNNIEVFRFVNHEIEIEIGDQVALDLIYGEYSKSAEVHYTLDSDDIITLDGTIATGIAAGEVKITATIDYEKYAYMIVRVVNPLVYSMKMIAPDNRSSIFVNEQLQLSVSVVPNTISKDVVWSLENNIRDDQEIAKITEDGKLTGLKGEQTDIDYRKGGVPIIVVATSKADPLMSVKKEIFVKYRPTSTVSLAAVDDKTEINLGETVQLTVTIFPVDANKKVTFTSRNEEILLVDENGLVSTPEGSNNFGTVTIVARTIDNKTSTIDITVIDPNPES